ncbi:MAG: 1-deoxy-D-xylulose-5-phosphate synthase [Nitrospirae bacterium]|nr:1-deoxy-D-xylulose-5-phosphate synthase [Nitrospirota bacterium]
MRGIFFKTLTELAEQDSRIILLTGDVGYFVLEAFAEKFPDRFFNVGVAEQNMMGIATGLAEAGFIPFVYSIAPFVVLRPYEFIRNGPILHRLPVRIVGSGGGFEYGPNGCTHNILEDIGILRTNPGITIISPADYKQTQNALLKTWNLPVPIYYRIGKNDKTAMTGLEGRFELGRIQIVREGTDLLFITMGGISLEVEKAARILSEHNIRSTVAVVASMNPSPIEDLMPLLNRFPLALAVEAHYVTGGLGSLVSEVIADHGIGCRIVRCGVREAPDGLSGCQDYLHDKHGLSAAAIVKTALKEIGVDKRVRT